MKIDSVICGAKLHAVALPLNSELSVVLYNPLDAVSEMLGKNAARAAPILAFAARRLCSAAMMSGRLVRRSDGIPGGSAAIRCWSSSPRPGTRSGGMG